MYMQFMKYFASKTHKHLGSSIQDDAVGNSIGEKPMSDLKLIYYLKMDIGDYV